jgi:hypothetical protein
LIHCRKPAAGLFINAIAQHKRDIGPRTRYRTRRHPSPTIAAFAVNQE